MRGIDKSRRAAQLDEEMTKLDKQLEFLESIEEWTEADGHRYDSLLEERDQLQDEYDKLVRG